MSEEPKPRTMNAVQRAAQTPLASRGAIVLDTVDYLTKRTPAELAKLRVEDDGERGIAVVNDPNRGMSAVEWLATKTGPERGPVTEEP